MKLEKILGNLNSLEKNSFIKIVDGIIGDDSMNSKAIDKLMATTDSSGLKNADNVVIGKIFSFVEAEYRAMLKAEFVNTSSQLDILIDIISRDGNCIMKREWFAKLYENELKVLNRKIKGLKSELDNEKSDISPERRRDYQIYKSCVHTAFYNDLDNNRDSKITDDELSILLTLSHQLELSQEEVKLINYMVVPAKRMEIDDAINELKNLGVIFYSKKMSTIYVADEMVRVLRKVREKEIADKFFRRILRLFKESQINLVCKKHNIDRKLPLDEKIKEIIKEGISFSGCLVNDVHKDNVNVSAKKKFLNELCDKGLEIKPSLKGTTLQDKLVNLIGYFDEVERDEKVGISVEGYDKLMLDLGEVLPQLNKKIKQEFELQDEHVMSSDYLLDYNIKPRDILDIIDSASIQKFIKLGDIKSRGNAVNNILEAYKDSENLFMENYVNIGYRNLNALKEDGIRVKEADLGVKFEELTKSIFTQLGFNVDENLKKSLNTKKDKMDILINLGNNEVIVVECKTIKESGYNKFSSVSRQLKAYSDVVKLNDLKVIKSLLIAPEFSDEFINETELEYDLNLSLITANSLITILDGFKKSKKHKQFPYKLLMRDVLIKEDRILKAISK
ncbi:MAG: hypothetical protein ACXAC2_07320 [Candidatus Kariarchaeaceae archaeon]|jgi:hypothetical protein